MLSQSGSSRRIWTSFGTFVLLCVVDPGQALAIPSPELIVSSLSSLTQLWALAGAVLGGGALAMSARPGKPGTGNLALRRWFMAVAALALAAAGLNVWQYWSVQAARTERLEASIVRPTPKRADGQTLDSLLREMPYSRQVESSMGLTPEQVAALIEEMEAGKRPEVIALDIRETAETEQGGLAGAKPLRFPDIVTSGIDFTGKTALLFCHNGNRSAETCARLKAMGIDCRFMVGGFEKWIVDGHVLAGTNARKLSDLRGLAAYPNQSTLLDTVEVKRLLKERAAVLVDVRYPGEFEAGHMPGALNLAVRPTPTVELEQRLAELPPGPVIVPCYDRRSCFFGDVLGLELTRRGREFLGRYTVPWEYYVPSTPPPHIQAWLAAANVTAYGLAARKLADGLEWGAEQFRAAGAGISGGLVAAILTLSLLSRMMVWPLAAKADRDQRTARVMACDVTELKKRFADDPARQARALRQLMDAHGLTPGRNLLALLFLPVLALSIEAVGLVAKKHAGEALEPLAWISDMSVPDPTYGLGIGFGVLLGVYLHVSMTQALWQRVLVWAVCVPLLAALGAVMPAASNLYMVASAALLLLQRWVTSWNWRIVVRAARRVKLAWTRWRLGGRGAILSLGEVAALETCGNKAARLAVLGDIGVPVPRGVVLTNDYLSGPEWSDPARRRASLKRVWRQAGVRRVAVRSSAGAEDGAQQSFAGVFETVLDVDRAGLERAIERVAASFTASRVDAYAQDAGGGNILIQPMIPARFAGVVFTQDPTVPGCGLVEWVAGNGEALVSGTASPKSVRVGRLTGTVEGEDKPPFDMDELWAWSRRIENRFGRPQDIEWAHDGRRFFILQARDIVALPAGPHSWAGDEWQRLAGMSETAKADPVLSVDQMAELLPRPTPASLSLLNAFWAGGGSMDLAARSIGFDAPRFDGDRIDARPLYVTVFGALYVDCREHDVRALKPKGGAVLKLRANAAKIEREMRSVILPGIVARAQVLDAVEPMRMTTAALLVLFHEVRKRLVEETHVAVDGVNIAAQLFIDEARKALIETGQDPALVLAHVPATRLRRGLDQLALKGDFVPSRKLHALLGHRAGLDYELSAPRFGEDEAALLAMAEHLTACGHRVLAGAERARLPKTARRAVVRAQRYVTLKEDAKHESLREVALLRRLMLEIDQRFELDGLVWQLGLDETGLLTAMGKDALRATLEERRARAAGLADTPSLPALLTRRIIERGPMVVATGALDDRADVSGVVRSTRVSGHAAVEGRAIKVAREICESGAPIPGFETGDIIVARSMHPAWLPQMMRSGGVVVETGGWLSHMAILARERGLAMSVGARGIDRIETGMRLRLELDGAVVCL